MNISVQFELRAIEEKLFRLSLDPAARGNEIATAAEKLINCLRARNVTAAEIFRGSKPTSAPDDLTLIRARNMRMTFGKYRRKRLGDVPISYLHWAKNNCDNMSADLRDAITVVLES